MRASLLIGPLGVVPGWQRSIRVADPAAGAANIDRKVTGDVYERIIAARLDLDTSAAVANRFVRFHWLDVDGDIMASLTATAAVAASSAVSVYGNPGGGTDISSSGDSSTPIPDLLIPPGWTFRINILAVQAGDTVTGVRLIVQQFPRESIRAAVPTDVIGSL